MARHSTDFPVDVRDTRITLPRSTNREPLPILGPTHSSIIARPNPGDRSSSHSRLNDEPARQVGLPGENESATARACTPRSRLPSSPDS